MSFNSSREVLVGLALYLNEVDAADVSITMSNASHTTQIEIETRGYSNKNRFLVLNHGWDGLVGFHVIYLGNYNYSAILLMRDSSISINHARKYRGAFQSHPISHLNQNYFDLAKDNNFISALDVTVILDAHFKPVG